MTEIIDLSQDIYEGMPVFKEILPYMTIDYKIDAVKKIINHDYSRKKK